MAISSPGQSPIDWQAIHNGQYVYEAGCWNTCGGGFCCNSDHPVFDFQLLPQKTGTVILYMEDEYHYFAKRGQIPPDPAQKLSIDFGGPRPFVLYHVFCGLLGRCDGVLEKPFLCKIYPFMPILNIHGELEGLGHASVFELTFELIRDQTLCSVFSKKEAYHRHWTTHRHVLDPLRHPYLIFYLQALKHFSKSYSKKLLAREDLLKMKGKKFWSEWELAYLRGELFDTQEIASALADTYQQLDSEYGEFLTPSHEFSAH